MASTGLDDLDMVFQLFQEIRKWTLQARANPDVALTVRRAEFRFAQAVRLAQEQGRVTSRHHRAGTPLTRYLPDGATYAGRVFSLMNVPEAHFESALFLAMENTNSMSFPAVSAELKAMAEVTPMPMTKRAQVQVGPTRRGERLIKNLAVTVSSLAATCREIHVSEVDGEQFAELVHRAREDVGAIRGFLKRVECSDV